MSDYAIEIKGLAKSFPGFQMKDLNLQIPKGYITGFIGPNGAGKSTTIKMMMSLMHPDSGEIKIMGQNIQDHAEEIKERIGFVYAENVFYDHLNIKETERLIAPFYKKWDHQKFTDLIQSFGLPKNKKVKDFSTGMKAKLSLAVALSHHADLILLDEPTSGLDPIVRKEILNILYDIIQDESKTIFFSSHITTDLEQIADYITFIYDGSIILNEEKDNLLQHYRLVKGDQKLLEHDRLKDYLIGLEKRDTGSIALTKEAEVFEEMYGDQLVIEAASLEDIMYYYTKREGF